MCQLPWATLTIPYSPWWTGRSSPSAFHTRAGSSLRTWMGALTIPTPAGKARAYGQLPAHGQCFISRVGSKIGQRPRVFNSARIRWRGERGEPQRHEDTKNPPSQVRPIILNLLLYPYFASIGTRGYNRGYK